MDAYSLVERQRKPNVVNNLYLEGDSGQRRWRREQTVRQKEEVT